MADGIEDDEDGKEEGQISQAHRRPIPHMYSQTIISKEREDSQLAKEFHWGRAVGPHAGIRRKLLGNSRCQVGGRERTST